MVDITVNRSHKSPEKIMNWKLVKGVVASCVALLIAGCGAGGGGGTNNGTTPGTTTATPTLTVALTDNTTGNAISTLSAGVTGRLTALLKDASGEAVNGALVTFSTNSTFGTFTPASGTTLTDATGTATMLINGGATSGANTVNVSAVWKSNGTDITATDTVNYLVAAAVPVALTITAPTFGTTPLSAYGTTSVSVTVGGTTTPLDVSFTSNCAANGKAVLTPSVTTIDNIATASYRDNGCGGTDSVTARITNTVAATSNLVVTAPSVSSIQFVSATPSIISLKGTGSNTLPETSIVKFKILDSSGNPISRTVDFTLSTTLGGITFSNGATTASATSDATNGEVQIAVNSGTLPTPLRVLATINGTTIRTQSNQLTITTGLPDQAHTSLSISTINIDGWGYDGITTTLTIRLADHLSNPVPDGTPVNFVAEGGRIDASCMTTNSECLVTFTSQNLRPSDGRITVLAYAVGEEAFTDQNGNGTVDSIAEMVDANGASTDMGEAFVDYNEDGVRDATEPFFDYDGGGYRAGGDGKYNGLLCTTGAAICSANDKSIHVNQSTVVVLSDSQPVINDMFRDSTDAIIAGINLGGCAAAGDLFDFHLLLRDLHGNALPAGTTITITANNGSVTFGGSQVVPNSGDRFAVSPTSSAFIYPFTIKNDAPTTGVCVDATPAGQLTVTVNPPVGATVVYSLPVLN